jgi:hypothetical protein
VASETTFRGRLAQYNRRRAVILQAGTPLDIRRDPIAGIPDATAQEASMAGHLMAGHPMVDRPMEDRRDIAALPIAHEATARRLMEAAAATADAATVDLLMVEAVARRLQAEDTPMAAGVPIPHPVVEAVRVEVPAAVVVPAAQAMEDDTNIS